MSASVSVSNKTNNLPISSLSEEFKVTHGGRDSSDAKVRITVKAGRKRKTQEAEAEARLQQWGRQVPRPDSDLAGGRERGQLVKGV